MKEPPKNTGQIPVLAPVAGEIIERLVGPGQFLQAGTTQCFTISDTSTVWVLVNVYQSDMASVRVGDAVDITTDCLPRHLPRTNFVYRRRARSHHAHPAGAHRDARTRNHKLKKDMYVTATRPRGRYCECAAGSRCSRAARHRKPAVRLRPDRRQSVRPAHW